MAWTQPIYDRTQKDVDTVRNIYENIRSGSVSSEEFALYQTDLKGAINTSDLHRIVGNMNYLSNLLNVTISTQTVPEIPRASWYATLRSNLVTLLAAYTKYSTTPDIPNRPFNTYEKWNTIEKILWDIKNIYENDQSAYAGSELFADDNLLI